MASAPPLLWLLASLRFPKLPLRHRAAPFPQGLVLSRGLSESKLHYCTPLSLSPSPSLLCLYHHRLGELGTWGLVSWARDSAWGSERAGWGMQTAREKQVCALQAFEGSMAVCAYQFGFLLSLAVFRSGFKKITSDNYSIM